MGVCIMKGVKDFLKDERAHNVCMIVTKEDTDKIHFSVMFDFDHLYDALSLIRKDIGPRQKQTRKTPADMRQIQMQFREDKNHNNGVVLFRVHSKNSGNVFPAGKGDFIALAPRVTADDEIGEFAEYDRKVKESKEMVLPAYVNPSSIPEIIL